MDLTFISGNIVYLRHISSRKKSSVMGIEMVTTITKKVYGQFFFVENEKTFELANFYRIKKLWPKKVHNENDFLALNIDIVDH